MVYGSAFNYIFSQNSQPKPTRQSSFEAYSKGNFELAYSQFSELLLTYSKDPLYKYYSGVCLVKLNKNPEEAATLLKQALNGAAVVKTLPSDALFYLGRAQQMSGKFSEAIQSYNLYSDQVGKKAAREQGISGFIQQCTENKGAVKSDVIKPDAIVKDVSDESVKDKSNPVSKDLVQAKVEKVISPAESITSGNEKLLEEALKFQFKSDSLNSLVKRQKTDLEKLPPAQKTSLQVKINSNELLAASYQKSADEKYRAAESSLSPGIVTNNQKEKVPQSVPPVPVVPEASKSTPVKSEITLPGNSAKEPENLKAKEADKQLESAINVAQPIRQTVETFVYFKVLSQPVTDSKEKIIIDPDVPAGLIYRIQTAVFRNPVSASYFKGITPVFGFQILKI